MNFTKSKRCKKGFSLLEVMVAIALFTFIVTATAGTFVSMQQAWRRQKAAINIAQNSRWAIEFMPNQIRHATTNGNPGWARIQITGPVANPRLSFGLDTNGDNTADTQVWFWLGNTASDLTGLGDSTFLYRGTGNNIGQAYTVRQQVANLIVNNPDLVDNTTGLPPADGAADPCFIYSGGLLTIELTFRPNPALPAGTDNKDFTIRTRVRTRN